jgi:hypothetical protein
MSYLWPVAGGVGVQYAVCPWSSMRSRFLVRYSCDIYLDTFCIMDHIGVAFAGSGSDQSRISSNEVKLY